MAIRIWVTFIYMCYKSNLKTTLELKGSTNCDNSWKKNLDLKRK